MTRTVDHGPARGTGMGSESGRPLTAAEARPHCNRFQKYIRFPKGAGCWVWIGARRTRDGYGCFGVGRHPRIQAHRFALALSGVDIPARAVVRHSCDNKQCVNPAHLSIGTQQDNRDDAVARGQARGARMNRNSAKVKWEDVVTMRAMRASGAKLSELATIYGITEGAVSMAVRCLTWRTP